GGRVGGDVAGAEEGHVLLHAAGHVPAAARAGDPAEDRAGAQPRGRRLPARPPGDGAPGRGFPGRTRHRLQAALGQRPPPRGPDRRRADGLRRGEVRARRPGRAPRAPPPVGGGAERRARLGVLRRRLRLRAVAAERRRRRGRGDGLLLDGGRRGVARPRLGGRHARDRFPQVGGDVRRRRLPGRAPADGADARRRPGRPRPGQARVRRAAERRPAPVRSAAQARRGPRMVRGPRAGPLISPGGAVPGTRRSPTFLGMRGDTPPPPGPVIVDVGTAQARQMSVGSAVAGGIGVVAVAAALTGDVEGGTGTRVTAFLIGAVFTLIGALPLLLRRIAFRPRRLLFDSTGLRWEDPQGAPWAVGWAELAEVTLGYPAPATGSARLGSAVNLTLRPADPAFHEAHPEMEHLAVPAGDGSRSYRVPFGHALSVVGPADRALRHYAPGVYRREGPEIPAPRDRPTAVKVSVAIVGCYWACAMAV